MMAGEMRTEYHVQFAAQRLISGTWDSDDCAWEWEMWHKSYKRKTAAENYFNKVKLTSDIPCVRLYEVLIEEKHNLEVESTLLDERWN